MTTKTQKIQLIRPEAGGFGFSIRGGAEHGLGIYVSEVEIGSEAHLQGMRTGDQILRVCGIKVEQATHKEVVNILKDRQKINLKVRSGGVIPVKEKRGGPITWRIVQTEKEKLSSGDKNGDEPRKSRGDGPKGEDQQDCPIERISINLKGQQGLGCSICKGPPERPGIFIQSTKVGRLAREIGLKPGDQIVACNGVDFHKIEFGDAVYHLKATKELNLVIKKRAGLDLFPNESSGYDSSASSSTGDADKHANQSIPKAPPFPKKTGSLASSKTSLRGSEADVRLSRSGSQEGRHQSRHADGQDGRAQGDIQDGGGRHQPRDKMDIEAERQRLFSQQEKLRREAEALQAERRQLEEEKEMFRRTLNKNSTRLSASLHDLSMQEVGNNRSSDEGYDNGSSSNYNTLKAQSRTRSKSQVLMPPEPPKRLSSTSAIYSGSSDSQARDNMESYSSGESSAGSLAAALQSEIRRRKEKANSSNSINNQGTTVGSANSTPVVAKGILKKTDNRKPQIISDKNERHDRLIAEFKEAHRRMFSSGSESDASRSDHAPTAANKSRASSKEKEVNGLPASNSAKQSPSTQSSRRPKAGVNSQDAAGKPKAPPPPPPIAGATPIGIVSTSHIVNNTVNANNSMAPAKDGNKQDSVSDNRAASGGGAESCGESSGCGSVVSSATNSLPRSKRGSLATTSTSSVESIQHTATLSTFRPNRLSMAMSSSGSANCVATPVFVPGIPTPDYDSTPDRSPSSHRKLFHKGRNASAGKTFGGKGGKHVAPPTVEGITRAKSLSSLVNADSADDYKDMRGYKNGKTRAPQPAVNPALKSVESLHDLRLERNPSTSIHDLRLEGGHAAASLTSSSASSPQSSHTSSLNYPPRDPMSMSMAGTSTMSSKTAHFARRHRDMEGVSMDSFQMDSTQKLDPKPPAIYFESVRRAASLHATAPSPELPHFRFQDKPCDPTQIPLKMNGEEAMLASQDYRVANALGGSHNSSIMTSQDYRVAHAHGGSNNSSFNHKTFKHLDSKSGSLSSTSTTNGFKKQEEKRSSFPRFTILKKQAPPPPVLRKI